MRPAKSAWGMGGKRLRMQYSLFAQSGRWPTAWPALRQKRKFIYPNCRKVNHWVKALFAYPPQKPVIWSRRGAHKRQVIDLPIALIREGIRHLRVRRYNAFPVLLCQ